MPLQPWAVGLFQGEALALRPWNPNWAMNHWDDHGMIMQLAIIVIVTYWVMNSGEFYDDFNGKFEYT